MKAIEVTTYPDATEALKGGQEVAILTWDGLGEDEETFSHVTVATEELASRISSELGWARVEPSDGYPCFIAYMDSGGVVTELEKVFGKVTLSLEGDQIHEEELA